VLLLHGTYWSRVWRPVLADLAAAGLRPIAWGEDDTFQEIRHAERFAAEVPNTTLVRVPRAGHIPMENDAATVARSMTSFFTG